MQAGLSFFDKKAPDVVVRSLFEKYDTNGNGKLDEKEMQTLLEGDLGLDREQTGVYIPLVDKNGDHDVSFEEFSDWLRSEEHFQILHDKQMFEKLSKAFRYFKSFTTDDGDTLDRVQFEELMKFFGYETIDMEKAFAKIDKDKNGVVSFWEFMVWLKWVPVLNWLTLLRTTQLSVCFNIFEVWNYRRELKSLSLNVNSRTKLSEFSSPLTILQEAIYFIRFRALSPGRANHASNFQT